MPVTVSSIIGGVSTSVRLLAGENPDRGYIGVVDGAGHYIQNIFASTSNRALQNVAGAAGDHLAKVFAIVSSALNAQLILKDGNAVALASTAVASATNTSLDVSGTPWTTDQWKGKIVEILTGTGAGQHRKITANDNNTLTVCHAWGTNPDATSTFQIYDGIELLPYNMAVGAYGLNPGIPAKNAGGWKLTTDTGVVVPLVTGHFT